MSLISFDVNFLPLKLMVRGSAGTGKSVIINTIVSYMRRVFDDNDVVHAVAPTGMEAFNVLGGTLHKFAGLDWRNMKKGMTNGTMEKLQKKLQNTVAILMDERSSADIQERTGLESQQWYCLVMITSYHPLVIQE
jgi:septin family protein